MKYLQISMFVLLQVTTCKSQSVDEKVVLINVEDYDNGSIAKVISNLNLLNPKVISLDLEFSQYSGTEGDLNLIKSLNSVRTLVMPSEISSMGRDYRDNEIIFISLVNSLEFLPIRCKSGFVSSKRPKKGELIPARFMTYQKTYTGDTHYHFSIITAMSFDSLRTVDFIDHHERMVKINFKRGRRKFKIFSISDVLTNKVEENDIAGKVVMIGFLGPGEDDKFISPLNRSGKKPDMYGLEYLAHIVAQILE